MLFNALFSAGVALAASSSAAVATGAATAVTAAAAQATVPITIKGNAFFRGNDRFYIKGIAYQPGGSSGTQDPLASQSTCDRDIPYFQQLGINTIRVYQVDNSANHDYCMQLLQKAGIYLVLDVSTAKNSLNRFDAASSYNAVFLQHIFATVDTFKGYPNTLGFFSSNEVVNDNLTTATSPWIKATIRDLKQYIAAQSSRFIPVGYSAADIIGSRVPLGEYLNCGANNTRADMYAINVYEWCGDATYQSSGYDTLTAALSNYSIPIFFSEFGCNQVTPRPFTEINALYGSQMTPVFSGGLVYEYTQEPSNYGVVDVSSGSVQKLTDFNTLQKQFAANNPSGSNGYKTGLPASVCPGNSSDFSGVWAEDVLPAQPAGAAAYIKNGAGQPLGDSTNSQQAGANAVPAVSPSAVSRSISSSRTSATASASSSRSAAAGPVRELGLSSLVAVIVSSVALAVGLTL
ncbi:1,3-beta-glucanosyltransferase [Savitreella phatthalungensis]